MVDPEENHWWFPWKTIGSSQRRPLVAPMEDLFWFPRKTICGLEEFRHTHARRIVEPVTAPKRSRRNNGAGTCTPKPARRNLHAETSTPKPSLRNVHAEMSATRNFLAGIFDRGHTRQDVGKGVTPSSGKGVIANAGSHGNTGWTLH